MTRYRFPASLGGGEYEAAADTRGYLRVGFDLPDVSDRLWLDRADLTVVTPPLPKEPDIASVVLDRHDRAWQHLAFGGRGDWCCTVDDLGADWGELNREHGPLTRLMPEPVVEPVTLPWFSSDKGKADVTVDTSNSWQARVYVHASHSHLLPNQARAMAGALNSAADAVERAA